MDKGHACLDRSISLHKAIKVCCLKSISAERHNRTRQLFALFSDVTKVKWGVHLKCAGWQNDINLLETNVQGPLHNVKQPITQSSMFTSCKVITTLTLPLHVPVNRATKASSATQKQAKKKDHEKKIFKNHKAQHKIGLLQAASTAFQQESTQHMVKY